MGLGLLLLPGMDGTGRLFEPFLEHVPQGMWTKVASYPTDRILGYDDLLPLIGQQVEPSVPHVVVAESFSGPLAVNYAHRRREDVAAIVFCGSFISNPLPLGLRCLPMLAHASLVTIGTWETVVRMCLLDSSAPATLVAAVRDAIRLAEPRVLVARMRETAAADATEKLKELHVPVLYILSLRDRIVGKRGARQVRAAAPHAEVRTLDAPHLVLQTKPREAVEIVVEFLEAKGLLAAPMA